MACYVARRNSKDSETLQVAIIELLLQHGLDVNAKDVVLWTPLHYLCRCYGSHRLSIALLLNNKADINARDLHSWPPLHYLCFANGENTETIKFLLVHKADVNAKAGTLGSFCTPLHCLCRGPSDSISSLRTLIAAGSNVSWENSQGQTPYEIAKETENKALCVYMENNHLTGR